MCGQGASPDWAEGGDSQLSKELGAREGSEVPLLTYLCVGVWPMCQEGQAKTEEEEDLFQSVVRAPSHGEEWELTSSEMGSHAAVFSR